MARKNLWRAFQITNPTRADNEARSSLCQPRCIPLDDVVDRGNGRECQEDDCREAIVSLDPSLVDASFVSERIEDDEEEFALFRQGMKDEGQLQPILVRPRPEVDGRYMIVFGHRRTRAAKELGVPVRAVVKNLEAIAHIIAQGQENSRRADLSFMEKALFAKKLLNMEQSKETIKSALSIDDTLLSRMLSVAETVPPAVIDAIGAAKTVGRDRWEELKKLLSYPKNADFAKQVVQSNEFQSGRKRGPLQLSACATETRAKSRSQNRPKLSDVRRMGA